MPSATKKTDNQSLASKVAIRRWLLARMKLTEVRVLDTCAGLGHVWDAMEEHCTIRQWTRCDVKPRRAGTLALSAIQAVRRFPLDVYNVIDVDPFGDPFDIYAAVLQRLTTPTAVFLTHGFYGGRSTSSAGSLDAMGLPSVWPIPRTPALYNYTAAWHLANTWRYVDVRHAAKVQLSHVTYYALGLAPKSQ